MGLVGGLWGGFGGGLRGGLGGWLGGSGSGGTWGLGGDTSGLVVLVGNLLGEKILEELKLGLGKWRWWKWGGGGEDCVTTEVSHSPTIEFQFCRIKYFVFLIPTKL